MDTFLYITQVGITENGAQSGRGYRGDWIQGAPSHESACGT